MKAHLARAALLLIAFVAFCYATASFFAQFEADFLVSAVITILSLGGIFVIDHLAHERERTAQGREWRNRILEPADWELEDDYLREVD